MNLIQNNTTHCAKLGLRRVQKSYIVASSAQVTAPGLFGGFSFRGLKKLKGGIHESTPHPRGKNTVKRNSKIESSRKSSEESETLYRSKFSRATGVRRLSQKSIKFKHNNFANKCRSTQYSVTGNTYTYTYIYTYTHIYIHTHICIHVCVLLCFINRYWGIVTVPKFPQIRAKEHVLMNCIAIVPPRPVPTERS